MNNLRYAVVIFYIEDDTLKVQDCGCFPDIQLAEAFRLDVVSDGEVNPQNVQVIQYAV